MSLRDETTQAVVAAIQAIGESFAASLRLDAVLERVIQSGMQLAGGDSGSIMLLSEDGRELVVTAAVGPAASTARPQTIRKSSAGASCCRFA